MLSVTVGVRCIFLKKRLEFLIFLQELTADLEAVKDSQKAIEPDTIQMGNKRASQENLFLKHKLDVSFVRFLSCALCHSWGQMHLFKEALKIFDSSLGADSCS